MAKKCPKCECPAGEKWAVPFADFLSLLLALFIALYALASVNVEKQKALKEEFLKIYGLNSSADTMQEQEQTEKSMTEKEIQSEVEGKKTVYEQAMTQLSQLESKNSQSGSLKEKDNGTIMSIPAQLLFDKGKSDLTNQYAPVFLSRLAKILAAMPEDTEINVKGYAEDSEVNKSRYKDALDLSTARANNVIRELLKYNIPSNRLYSSGYGSNKSGNLKDKRVVVFELQTMQKVEEGDVDLETIFNNMKDNGQQ